MKWDRNYDYEVEIVRIHQNLSNISSKTLDFGRDDFFSGLPRVGTSFKGQCELENINFTFALKYEHNFCYWTDT